MSQRQRHSWNFCSRLTRLRPPVFGFLFLFVLFLPLLKSIVSPAAKYSLQDAGGRPKSTGLRNEHSLDFLRDWNAVANQHFAGRDELIHWNNLLQVRLLRVSPVDTLMLGRDGWLFLDGSNLEMDYFRAATPFSEDELARWRRALLQRHLWLARQGIRFVFVVAPNKSTIYPEQVPARFRRAATRLDQLLDYLGRRPLPAGFRMLDLRKKLRAAKPRYPVYGKIDSHWNGFGAMLAAQRILQTLSGFYPLRPPTAADFEVSLEPGSGPRGDLAAMLSLADVLSEPHRVKVAPRSPARMVVAEPAHWITEHLEREITICPGAGLPEALMFRDSFGYALAGFLSEHFKKMTYIRDIGLGFHPRIVLQVRPKIVIQEMAERFFLVLSPVNPPELEAIEVDR
jgi:hypothetical protein